MSQDLDDQDGEEKISGKWDRVSSVIDKSHKSSGPAKSKSLEQLHQQQHIQVPHSNVQKPEGAIAQYKANQLGKKVALQQIAIWYRGQIEATEHAVNQVVRVRKAEATKIAERLLLEINEEHFRYLTSLGLRNETTRHKAMLELGDQTAQMLKEIDGRDWPPQLIEQAMHGVMERQNKFFQKLMEDLGEE
jgi:hypothetical protein